MTEKWREIPSYEGFYEISTLGNVRSMDRVVHGVRGSATGIQRLSGRAIRAWTESNGYTKVALYQGGRRKNRWVHSLVLEAFVGPCPPGMEVCHNNGSRSDNRLENLRYGTRSENMRASVRHGTHTIAATGKRLIQPSDPRWITPGSERHRNVVSASKVAAICGVSRWTSPYALWHQMKGWVDPEPPKEIFDTGHAMEKALAELWRRENLGWRLSRGEVQAQTEEYGFPACVSMDRVARKGSSFRIVEMKIARDLSEWGDPDLAGDCPADYLLQVIAQQTFSGLRKTANLIVMGPFFKHRTYMVEFDESVSSWMVEQCRDFYDSLSASIPPPLDNTVATYETVRKLHPDIEYGVKVEVPESLAVDIHAARINAKQAEVELRGLKTKLLDIMAGAQYATVNDEIVADRRPHGKGGIALNVR